MALRKGGPNHPSDPTSYPLPTAFQSPYPIHSSPYAPPTSLPQGLHPFIPLDWKVLSPWSQLAGCLSSFTLLPKH